MKWLPRLSSANPQDTEPAWKEFLDGYARIIMQVISICERNSENRHECFVYVCEQLCRRRFHRLRQFHMNGPATFATWLRTVVRNLCIDWQRKQPRGQCTNVIGSGSEQIGITSSAMDGDVTRGDDIAASMQDCSDDPEMLAAKREQILALGSALSTLPLNQRLVLRLRFQQELTLQEIARTMGLKNAQAADRLIRETLDQLHQTIHRGNNFLGKTKPASV